MDVRIRSGGVELLESVRVLAAEKVQRAGRHLEGMERAEVRFVEEHNPRIANRAACEVTMYGHGHVVRGPGAAAEPLAALDVAVDRLGQRLRRLKGRLVSRSHPRHRNHEPRLAAPDGSPPGEAEDSQPQDRIVRTKQFAIKPMTPEEAALQMDLLSHSFFLFTNAESGRAAVVYRRNEGDVGLIEAR